MSDIERLYQMLLSLEREVPDMGKPRRMDGASYNAGYRDAVRLVIETVESEWELG